MLALHTHAHVSGDWPRSILKVLRVEEALECRYPLDRVLLDLRKDAPYIAPDALRALGISAALSDGPEFPGVRTVCSLENNHVVKPGDVVKLRPGQVRVLYRRGANANFLLATERCNSFCLMCSQPPRDVDDGWRIAEMLETIDLIDHGVAAIGITGGEPTLLGDGLAKVIDAVRKRLPGTQLNILTNGRLLADQHLATMLTTEADHVLWAVPLYGHVADRHDYVVQAAGAFEETLHGLYNLAERRQAIELRCVLQKVTIGRLNPFAEFVWRNLPFVRHVAFMGLEPAGFAKANREALYVDLLDHIAELEQAVWYLNDRGITASIYNVPLCLLSRSAWPLAKQTISDWKNDFLPECDGCLVRDQCSGFFSSADQRWRSRGIRPIREEKQHDTRLECIS